MVMGIERFLADLKANGQIVEGPLNSGGLKWLIIPYTIPGGRFGGQSVRIAVPIADDYPQTPPGGLYVSPKLVHSNEMAKLNVLDRTHETGQLPGEWQYWSRPVPQGTWKANNGTSRLRVHWNTVMMNV